LIPSHSILTNVPPGKASFKGLAASGLRLSAHISGLSTRWRATPSRDGRQTCAGHTHLCGLGSVERRGVGGDRP
jgi:hypothetical protein